MTKIMEWLKGRKTYITAIVYAIAAILTETGIYVVPDVVFTILGALGLITLRQAIGTK